MKWSDGGATFWFSLISLRISGLTTVLVMDLRGREVKGRSVTEEFLVFAFSVCACVCVFTWPQWGSSGWGPSWRRGRPRRRRRGCERPSGSSDLSVGWRVGTEMRRRRWLDKRGEAKTEGAGPEESRELLLVNWKCEWTSLCCPLLVFGGCELNDQKTWQNYNDNN